MVYVADHRIGERVRGAGVVVATVALVVSSLVLIGSPTPGVAAVEEPVATTAALKLRTQPGVVRRTISFRTVLAWPGPGEDDPVAGRYVTLRNDFAQSQRMYDAKNSMLRPRQAPNPILVEYGVFKAEKNGGKVRLLAANGLWVRLKNGAAVADAKDWDDATLFKVVAPAKLTKGVVDLLAHEGDSVDPIPTDGLVCILAYANSGDLLGRLGIRSKTKDNGVVDRSLRLVTQKKCGGLAKTLFHTDLAAGTKAIHKIDPAAADPLLHVRFVPPDHDPFPDGLDVHEITQDIDLYFNAVHDDLQDVHAYAKTQFDNAAGWMKPESYTNPDPPKSDVFSGILGGLVGMVSVIPYVGQVAVFLGGAYFVTAAGMTMADEANREEPRVIASVNNKVLLAEAELRSELLTYVKGLKKRASSIGDRILAGCAEGDPGSCISQRAMAAWAAERPARPTYSQRSTLVDTVVAGLEHEMWPVMLRTRGTVYAPVGAALRDWGSCNAYWDLGTGMYGPTDAYWFYEESPVPYVLAPTNGGVVSPTLVVTLNCEYNWDPGSWIIKEHHEFRPVVRGYVVGLKNNAAVPPTQLPQDAVDRLFDTYDPEDPIDGGGLGFSKRDIACMVPDAYPTDVNYDGQQREPRDGDPVVSHPCHFKYTTDEGEHWDSPLYDYTQPTSSTWRWRYYASLVYKPPMWAIWVPDQAEIDDGRPLLPLAIDKYQYVPQVVPVQEPRAAWSACSADPPASTSSGAATEFHWLNMAGEQVKVWPLDANGNKTGRFWIGEPLADGRTHLERAHMDYLHARRATDAHVGQVFLFEATSDNRCLGYWTATAGNDNGNYSVAEVHWRLQPNERQDETQQEPPTDP